MTELKDKDKITINVIKLYYNLIKSGLSYQFFNDNFTQKELMKKFNISNYMWRKWYNSIYRNMSYYDVVEGDF